MSAIFQSFVDSSLGMTPSTRKRTRRQFTDSPSSSMEPTESSNSSSSVFLYLSDFVSGTTSQADPLQNVENLSDSRNTIFVEKRPTAFTPPRFSRSSKPKRQRKSRWGETAPTRQSLRSSAASSSDSGSESSDDEHYSFSPGESIHHRRYSVLKEIGRGTFGNVGECWDRTLNQEVAIKVVRKEGEEDAHDEARILRELFHDAGASKHLSVLHETFTHQNRFCLVFERLGPSLFSILKANHFKAFRFDLVKKLAFNILEGLAFLHEHGVVHTDLKPENILFSDPRVSASSHRFFKKSSTCPSADIKMIDFGCALNGLSHSPQLLQTRYYRAPEVILGLPFDESVDIFSVGAILFEIYSGQVLLKATSHGEHLAMMERVLGPFPSSLVDFDSSDKIHTFFHHDGRLRWPSLAEGAESEEKVTACCSLSRLISSEHDSFRDLLGQLLDLDPKKRPSARAALSHPFFL